MHKASIVVFAIVTAFLPMVSSVAAQSEKQPSKVEPALQGFDPVELVQGNELKGDPTIDVQRGRFRYAFANEANRDTFQRDPERYGIQFGGACMRMGPLSGGGDSSRFTVYEGRIYAFASDGCRKGFLSDPPRFIDGPDAVVTGTQKQAEAARACLARAIEALGGASALKELTTIEVETQITVPTNNGLYKYSKITATSFPATHSRISFFDGSTSGWVLHPERGYLTWENGAAVEQSVFNHMKREFYRDPLVLMKAWQNSEYVAFHAGVEEIGGESADRVHVSLEGATSTIFIHQGNGRILRIAYRGRSGSGICSIENDFSDYREVHGVFAPFVVSSRANGKPENERTVVITSVRVNHTIDPHLIGKPE
jgi:YHS domain-containing protein